MKFHTRTLSSGSLVISAADGVMSLSVQANDASSANVLGNFPFQQVPSNGVTLTAGEALTVTAPSPASPLDGITIDWLEGTVDIILGF